MEKILVTGCLGHIGSALTHTLAVAGKWKITGLDIKSWSNALWGLTSHAHLITQDFADTSIEFLEQFDIVIHLAAITDAANSFGNEHLWKVNVGDTKDFIARCKAANIQHFIFPSSTSVYGPQEDGTIVGELVREHINPQSPYADGKIEIERFIEDSGLNYTILRQGTVCGTSSGMRFHTAINKFCLQAYKREELTVWEQNVDMERPYLTLPAICWTFLRILESPTRFYNQVFNLITSNKLLSTVLEHVNDACRSLLIPLPKINFVDTPLLNQHSYEVDGYAIREIIARATNYNNLTPLSYPDIKHQVQETMSYLVSGNLNPIWKIQNRESL